MIVQEELRGARNQPPAVQLPASGTASEADHRIGNSLMLVATLLRAQARHSAKRSLVTGDEMKAHLNDAAARIDVIAQLHRLLATCEEERLDCGDYLRRVVEAAEGVGSRGQPIAVTCNFANSIRLKADRLAALGMLANEIIVNAQKHAHPSGVAGQILVSLQKIGGDCVLVIEDDGVGLPDEFDPEADGGFGFKTMRQLAARLHAQIKHLSSPLGLRTEIVFRL